MQSAQDVINYIVGNTARRRFVPANSVAALVTKREELPSVKKLSPVPEPGIEIYKLVPATSRKSVTVTALEIYKDQVSRTNIST